MNPDRRIMKETQELMKEPVPGIVIRADPSNLRYFFIEMNGPPDTPYDGGVFEMELFLPKEYPMLPPRVRFLTKIYHPNIDSLGRICLGFVCPRWYSISFMITESAVCFTQANSAYFCPNYVRFAKCCGSKRKNPESNKCLNTCFTQQPHIIQHVLKERWTPALQIRTALLSIQSLLASPNPDSALNDEVAEQWRKSETTARDIARSWTNKYATKSAGSTSAVSPTPDTTEPRNSDVKNQPKRSK